MAYIDSLHLAYNYASPTPFYMVQKRNMISLRYVLSMTAILYRIINNIYILLHDNVHVIKINSIQSRIRLLECADISNQYLLSQTLIS